MTQKYRLIILGAGFSRPAGFPLAMDLWKEIRETAGNFGSHLRASKINDDLQNYIEFRGDADGIAIKPDAVDFEDFMRFLDIEHHLGLRGGETWSRDGNEGTVVTKYLIGKILTRHLTKLEEIPELYLEFANRLQPNDTVITFNYDTLLEQALEKVGKPYRLFSTRYKDIGEFSGRVDDRREEVVVLKVHGSIDWFDRSDFDRQLVWAEKENARPPEHVVFSNENDLKLIPLTDGPRFDTDPLKNLYRVKNLKELYDKDILFNATPRMLPPSGAKLLYSTRLNDFWEGMGNAGYYNFGMAIVGFSLPQQDEYAKQILFSFTKNYQGYNWGKDQLGREKSPLAIIDFFPDTASEERFRERYRFVDWSRANLYGAGFDLISLDKIFA